jgi:hypothetical protein
MDAPIARIEPEQYLAQAHQVPAAFGFVFDI